MQISEAPLHIDVQSGHAQASALIGRQRPILRRPSPSANQSEERALFANDVTAEAQDGRVRSVSDRETPEPSEPSP